MKSTIVTVGNGNESRQNIVEAITGALPQNEYTVNSSNQDNRLDIFFPLALGERIEELNPEIAHFAETFLERLTEGNDYESKQISLNGDFKSLNYSLGLFMQTYIEYKIQSLKLMEDF